MRIPARLVLSCPQRRDRFLQLLAEYKIKSKPKRVTGDHELPFVQVSLPVKWHADDIRSFLDDLERLAAEK